MTETGGEQDASASHSIIAAVRCMEHELHTQLSFPCSGKGNSRGRLHDANTGGRSNGGGARLGVGEVEVDNRMVVGASS